MYLRRLIKNIALILILLNCSEISSFGQKDTLHYIESKYRTEYTPYFIFGKFERGFFNDSLKIALDKLEETPRNQWSRHDSLTFAEISLQTGNTNLAHYYFEHLDVNYKTEEIYWYDHLMVTYLENNYKEGLSEIKKSSPMILEFSEIYFFQKIFEAKKEAKDDTKWYKTNKVLNWEIDTTLFSLDKESEEYKESVIYPLENLEKALKKIVTYVHEDDQIISSVCREMGHIIEAHLSLTQAYIAYSLGRHYNKWDKELLADVKAVKAKMNEQKYKIPIFRKYFPRIEYWRFDYGILKEKVIFDRTDTVEYQIPPTMKPKPEEKEEVIPSQIIILAGISIFILLVIIFVKSRSK